MKEKSVKRNALFNVIYTITNMLFPLITYPYVTRVLSATGMGKVSFFTSVSNYAVMIGSLGISTYGIRAVAKVRENKKELSKVATELFVLNSFITALVVVALVLSIHFVDKFSKEPMLLLINLVVIATAPFGLNWLYTGMEQYEYITKRTISLKTISVLMVFFLVKGKSDYPIYAVIMAFSSVGAYACNLIYSRNFVSFSFNNRLNYRRHLVPMLLLFASILAVSVYTNLDTIMLGFINGDREVGLYTVASKVKWLLLSAVNAISAVLMPRLSNYISNHKTDKYNSMLKKSVSFIFLITVPLSIYFTIEAFDVVMLLGGSDYKDAVLCMQFLMPILVISGFSNVTGNQILIPKGKDYQFMRAVATGAIIDIILNMALMPRLAALGAAIATLIAELIQMGIQLHYSKREIAININYRTVINSVIAGGIAGGVVVITRLLVVNSFINLLLTSAVFGIIYILALMLLKETYLKEIYEMIKKKITIVK